MNDEHLISTTPGIEPRAPFRDRTYTSSQVRALLDEVLKEIESVPNTRRNIAEIIQKQKEKL